MATCRQLISGRKPHPRKQARDIAFQPEQSAAGTKLPGPELFQGEEKVPLKTRQWAGFFEALAASGQGNVTPAARWVSDLFSRLENQWIITASQPEAAKAAEKEGQHET